jgi:hypothetical protein
VHDRDHDDGMRTDTDRQTAEFGANNNNNNAEIKPSETWTDRQAQTDRLSAEDRFHVEIASATDRQQSSDVGSRFGAKSGNAAGISTDRQQSSFPELNFEYHESVLNGGNRGNFRGNASPCGDPDFCVVNVGDAYAEFGGNIVPVANVPPLGGSDVTVFAPNSIGANFTTEFGGKEKEENGGLEKLTDLSIFNGVR